MTTLIKAWRANEERNFYNEMCDHWGMVERQISEECHKTKLDLQEKLLQAGAKVVVIKNDYTNKTKEVVGTYDSFKEAYATKPQNRYPITYDVMFDFEREV